MKKLLEMVVPTAIVVPLAATDRDAAVGALVDALVRAGSLPEASRDDLASRILARERVHSTGIGLGVAVPHAKNPANTPLMVAVGVAPRGIDFASLDRHPVYSVVLLVSPENNPDEHLAAMEALIKHLSKDSFRRSLRQAQNPGDVLALLRDADAQQLPA